jgi:hypothetical protein
MGKWLTIEEKVLNVIKIGKRGIRINEEGDDTDITMGRGLDVCLR